MVTYQGDPESGCTVMLTLFFRRTEIRPGSLGAVREKFEPSSRWPLMRLPVMATFITCPCCTLCRKSL